MSKANSAGLPGSGYPLPCSVRLTEHENQDNDIFVSAKREGKTKTLPFLFDRVIEVL